METGTLNGKSEMNLLEISKAIREAEEVIGKIESNISKLQEKVKLGKEKIQKLKDLEVGLINKMSDY